MRIGNLAVALAACSGSPTPSPTASPQALASTPADAAPDAPNDDDDVADNDPVTRLFHAHIDVVKQCYRGRVKVRHELAGKLYVTVRFDGQGELTNLVVSGIEDAPLVQCVTDGFTRAHLRLSPSEEHRSEAVVPFVLVPD